MFKINAYSKGKLISFVTLQENKDKSTNAITAMMGAKEQLALAGTKYDELRVSFTTLSADINKLNELYLNPNDPVLTALEKSFDGIGKKVEKTEPPSTNM